MADNVSKTREGFSSLVEAPDRCPAPDLESTLIDLAVESWRFSRLFVRAVSKLDAGEAPRCNSQLRYFLKRVEESLARAQLKLVETRLAAEGVDHRVESAMLELQLGNPALYRFLARFGDHGVA